MGYTVTKLHLQLTHQFKISKFIKHGFDIIIAFDFNNYWTEQSGARDRPLSLTKRAQVIHSHWPLSPQTFKLFSG